jgi:Bifunctional DNA primase/polymerase, N-terminal/AAA domain
VTVTTTDQYVPPSRRDLALAYAARGWHVFPCAAGGKTPLTRNGFKDATTDPAIIAEWWKAEHNIGIACGPAGLLILDEDRFNALQAYAERHGHTIPPTYTVKTSKGRHYYFAMPAGANLGNAPGVFKEWGIDVRGVGGYVIAAGSRHETGALYEVEDDREPAPLPDWVINAIGTKPQPKTATTADALPDGEPKTVTRAYVETAVNNELAELARHTTPDTDRNEQLNISAGNIAKYFHTGVPDEEDMRAKLTEIALEIGLDPGEIPGTIRSAFRHGKDNPKPVRVVPDLILFPGERDEPSAEDDDGDSKPINWHELWADESEEEWFVEPLISARRMVALYSPPKAGKSLLMLEIAAALAAGRVVLGQPATQVRRRHVLYVDFENDPQGDIKPRLQDMGYGPDDLDYLHYLLFPTLEALDSPAGGKRLLRYAQRWKVELVVIDTVSRTVDGDENSNDTWTRFYRHSGLLLKKAGIACLRLDHTGKDESKGMRGGSAKYGDVDAVWRLREVTKDEVYVLELTDSRMRVTERMLTLHRETEPLHHRVAARAKLDAFEAKVAEVVELCEKAGLKPDAGRPAVRGTLTEHERKASNDVINAAIRRRKLSAGLPDSDQLDDHEAA